jgi:hypothetical protein
VSLPSLRRAVLAVGVSCLAAATLAPAAARATDVPPDSTPILIEGEELRAALFLAIDMPRLTGQRSACEALTLEAVLLERFAGDAAPSQGATTIAGELAGLRAAYRSARGIDACERRFVDEGILDLLAFAEGSSSLHPDTKQAVRRVAQRVLMLTAEQGNGVGDRGLTALGDLSASLTGTSLAPTTLLRRSLTEAVRDPGFAAARDLLFSAETGQSITDDIATLRQNPRIANSAIAGLITGAEPRVSTDVGTLMARVGTAVSVLADTREGAVDDLVATDSGALTGEAAAANAQQRVEIIAREQGALAFFGSLVESAGAVGSGVAAALRAQAARVGATARLAIESAKAFNDLVRDAIRNSPVGGVLASYGKGVRKLLDIGQRFLMDFSYYVTGKDQRLINHLQVVRDDIAELRAEMNDRFDRVDAKLDAIYAEMVARFDDIAGKLERIETDLRTVRDEMVRLAARVERLERNVYALFKDSQNRELWTQVNTAIGWRERSLGGAPMSNEQFLTFEGFFFSWVTNSAYDSIAVGPPSRPYDEDSLESELTAVPLEGNLAYLSGLGVARFGLAPLSANPLPNLRDFSVAARAYSALLVENPEYVTDGVRQRLDVILDRGRQISAALARLGVRDAPGDGTESRAFNGALALYRSAGTAAESNGKHSVASALAAVESAYIGALTTPRGNPLGLDLWGSADQPGPGLDSDTPYTEQVCGDSGPFGVGLATPTTMSRTLAFSPRVRNALRLGTGEARVVCEVTTADRRAVSGTGARTDHYADFTVQFRTEFRTTGSATWSVVLRKSKTYDDVLWCTGFSASECTTLDPLAEAAERWTPFTGPSWKREFEETGTSTVPAIPNRNLEIVVENALRDRQVATYQHVLGQFGAQPLRGALGRLTGAKGVLEAYVEFGLWRQLQDDGTLRGLLYGSSALPSEGAEQTVGAQYAAAITSPPPSNVRGAVVNRIAARATELEAALGRTLVAATRPPAATSAEVTGLTTNPLVESTNARLLLSRSLPVPSSAPPADPPPADPGAGGGTGTVPPPAQAPTPDPAAPVAPAPAPDSTPPAAVTPQDSGQTAPRPKYVTALTVRPVRIGKLSAGLPVEVRATRAGRFTASLTVTKATARKLGLGRSTVLGRATAKVRRKGTVTARIRLGKKARSRLLRTKRVAATVTVAFTAANGTRARTVTKKVTLRR